MMIAFWLCVSVTSMVSINALQNRAGKLFAHDRGSLTRFQFLSFLLCLVLFASIACFGSFSLYTVLLGLAFGLFTFMSNFFKVEALANGPMHITVLITTSAMLIPTLSGCLFFGEAFSLWKLAAAIILIFFLYLASSAGKGGKFNKKWLLLALTAFLGSGIVGVLQKVHQSSPYKEELFLFLGMAFAVSSLLTLLPLKKNKPASPLTGRTAALSLACGFCVFAMNAINLRLSGQVPSQLFFPLVNGSSMVISALLSVFLFKEKLTLRQVVGLVGGFGSLIALCLLP